MERVVHHHHRAVKQLRCVCRQLVQAIRPEKIAEKCGEIHFNPPLCSEHKQMI